jgi:GDP-L-fucose synthase
MKIFVAGHKGLVGASIVSALDSRGDYQWVGRTRKELDLLDRKAVFQFMQNEKFDIVIMAAARVGGIKANVDYPVEFLMENLQVQLNIIQAAHEFEVGQLVFLGSSCIYPKFAEQPIKEEYLLSGPLEETNRPYALAKIAGIEMVRSYRKEFGHKWISIMPTNLYGPNDNFDFESSHVLPALIAKFHDAKINNYKTLRLWGTGEAKREFLHVSDLAEACIFLMENYNSDIPINVGTGREISIRKLAELISGTVGYSGEILWDSNMPDGTPRKLLDVSKINKMGWSAKIDLSEGIHSTYKWYVNSIK